MGRKIVAAIPLVGAVLYLAVPFVDAAAASTLAYNAVAIASVVAFAAVFALRRPEPARAWALIGVALAAWVIGDLVYSAVGAPVVSAADAFYMAGNASFAGAIAMFFRARVRERDVDSALDAALIATAGFLLVWITVIAPAWQEPGVSTLGRLTTAAYPLLDLVLLFFLLRLILPPGRPSGWLLNLTGCIAAFLVADALYAALQQTDAYQDELWHAFDALWLAGYALIPIAGVVARDDWTTAHVGRRPHQPSRLAGLLAAGIAVLALVCADIASRTAGQPITTAVLAVTGGIIIALVFARILRLHNSLDVAFAEVDRQQRYYRAVADHSSDSFVVISSQGVVLDASPTLGALTGFSSKGAIGANALSAVHPEDRDLARALLDDAIANPGLTILGEVRVLTSDGDSIWMELYCTNLCGDPAVGGIVVNAHDVTARKSVEEELEHRALHDTLTGLANRALFRDRLELALLRRKRGNTNVAVLFCDLDGFKLANDTVGHDAGDEVLQIAADRFRSSVRPDDTLARLGGDEFAVLIESGGDLTAEADSIAQRLLRAMAQPVEVRGTPMVVTTSIGIAIAGRIGDCTPDALLRQADTAMYNAKSTGRNRAVVYEQTMGTTVVTQMQLASDIRDAVERDEFRLLYQPIVDLRTGAVTGFEALLRWLHPRQGLLTPAEFMAVAEGTGAIVEIGNWVLRTATRDARGWNPTADGRPALVSVNVSGQQLVRADFVDEVSRALVESGLPAHSLLIELTESALVAHIAQAAERLQALKSIGVRIAIDDFGVGHSSLSYLRQFPVDVIKLDRSFVGTITEPDEVPALIGALLELTRTLELHALAEGIETSAQLAALTAGGCDFGQGFIFSAPVDSTSAAHLLVAGVPPQPYASV
jgi:diguanylate cyclase (GGDEF)-like protein/PAS domain S-box-containing protein